MSELASTTGTTTADGDTGDASTTSAPRTVRISKPNGVVACYSVLLKQVRKEGPLNRRLRLYISGAAVLVLAMGAAWTGFAPLGDTWFQLLIAAVFGVVLTQIVFLAREASHRQIFHTRGADDWSSRALAAGVVGTTYAWWMDKHTGHHTDPNRRGKDPDIKVNTISFLEEDASKTRGIQAWITRRQGHLFFPLLTFEGIDLNARFAPTHKGMPVVPKDSKLDFFQKQVLTSRNIGDRSFINNAFSGLNFQIEHHPFPDVPRAIPSTAP